MWLIPLSKKHKSDYCFARLRIYYYIKKNIADISFDFGIRIIVALVFFSFFLDYLFQWREYEKKPHDD